jgi:hypothetical protein
VSARPVALTPQQHITMSVSRPKPLGPEVNPWFWNPNHPSITHCPSWFAKALREMDGGEDLACTWNPVNERWQIWSRSPRFAHPICHGWRLLFIHQDADHNYLPLDPRVFARLYSASARVHGSAKAYFDRITREFERDQEKKEARLNQEAVDRAMPQWTYSQIKNIGRGSKFSEFFA